MVQNADQSEASKEEEQESNNIQKKKKNNAQNCYLKSQNSTLEHSQFTFVLIFKIKIQCLPY